MMIKFSAALLPVLLFFIIQARLSTSIEIRIFPTCSSRISSCHTLSTVPTGTNFTLALEPGVHMVSSALTIQRKRYLKLKGNGLAIIACTPTHYSSNIRISYNSEVAISGLTFSGCNIQFSGTNNTAIENTKFKDGAKGIMEFLNCQNVTVDRSHFSNNSDSSFGGVIEFSNTKGIQITRSNFTNNHVSSFAGIIGLSASAGTIGCSHFYNNSASSFGGVVTIERQSSLHVSNSSFKNSTLSSFGGVIHLDSTNDDVVVVSSVFMNNEHGAFGGVIVLDSSKSSATIITSKFINTWSSRRYSRRGTAVYSNSPDVTMDCCEFINTSLPTRYANNANLCSNYNNPGICEDTKCKLTGCRPPLVKISLERSEYTVSENIGKSSRALQVCAITKDLLFRVKVNLQIQNGSATELEDFVTGSPDCRILKFNRKAGTQKSCAYIRIIEDSVNEGNEQFHVSLESFSSQVVFETQRATITITENGPEEPEPTTEMPVSGLSKVALVECGPLHRVITYASGGNDLDNLRTAIAQAFRGLTGMLSGHIALLQVKSDIYGDYIDEPFPSSAILRNNSQVKVLTYGRFTCQPIYVPEN